jgi:hypothetical protein
MKRCGRQSPERFRKRNLRDASRFGYGVPGDLLREEGSAGNRSRTAAAKKAGFEDASIFDACCKPENVSTRRIADLNGSCRTGKNADVARIAEMIEDGFAKHAYD